MSWQARQRVNFYLPEFQPVRLPPAFRQLLRQLLILLGLLVLVVVGLALEWRYNQSRLQQQQQVEVLRQGDISRQHQRLRMPEADAGLQQQITHSEQRLQQSQQRLALLTQIERHSRLPDGSQSFLPLLSQLGSVSSNNVWLAEIAIRDQGQQIALSGQVREPVAVSRYLAQLGLLPAYQQRRFQQIGITGQMPGFGFVLDTRPAKPGRRESVWPIIRGEQP
tara:strand:- start:2319 stop:2984 length:666 start_codon:yes stop_codon:yes gene_type:complete